jgi:hypothetical protein
MKIGVTLFDEFINLEYHYREEAQDADGSAFWYSFSTASRFR